MNNSNEGNFGLARKNLFTLACIYLFLIFSGACGDQKISFHVKNQVFKPSMIKGKGAKIPQCCLHTFQ